MKPTIQRNWAADRPARRARMSVDPTMVLGGLTLILFGYIVYHIYPLLAKGLLW